MSAAWTHLHGLPPVPPHAPRHPVPVTTRPPRRRPSRPAGARATAAGVLALVAGRIGARRAGAAT